MLAFGRVCGRLTSELKLKQIKVELMSVFKLMLTIF